MNVVSLMRDRRDGWWWMQKWVDVIWPRTYRQVQPCQWKTGPIDGHYKVHMDTLSTKLNGLASCCRFLLAKILKPFKIIKSHSCYLDYVTPNVYSMCAGNYLSLSLFAWFFFSLHHLSAPHIAHIVVMSSVEIHWG